MNRTNVAIKDFRYDASQLRDQRLVLFAGDFGAGAFNAMTIGWGSYERVWNKMCFQVLVRPSRYTYEFMEKYDTFTLNAFGPEYKDAVAIFGTKSGRDCDKIALTGLTPMASSAVAAPCFAEANLVIECRKIYWQDLDKAHFLDRSIGENYLTADYHRVYIGEILGASEA